MTTTLAPDVKADHTEGEQWPTLGRHPTHTTREEFDAHSFDPTQGRKIGADPFDDPTRGRTLGYWRRARLLLSGSRDIRLIESGAAAPSRRKSRRVPSQRESRGSGLAATTTNSPTAP